ncbi:hypothetical protein ACFQZ4_15040 [Catellatospora coxensis]
MVTSSVRIRAAYRPRDPRPATPRSRFGVMICGPTPPTGRNRRSRSRGRETARRAGLGSAMT